MGLLSHYFIDDPAVEHKSKSFKYFFKSREYTFVTNSGVFSPDGIDGNTAFMLRHIQRLSGSLLDMGCGYGCIGIILGGLYGLEITQVDINQRAVNLTIENAKQNGVPSRAFVSDCYAEVDETFDTIVINPPVHAGKNTIYKMYEGAPEHLNQSGILYTVLLKKHGAENIKEKLTGLFGNCETVIKEKGRFVFKCIKQ